MIKMEINKICYIFDVDGTLTEPRTLMPASFANEFYLWSKDKQCVISTGSDYSKTKQQIPEKVLNNFKYIFCCMSNEVRTTEETIYKSEFLIPDELDRDLAEILHYSAFPYKVGNHLEFRTGMVNFSIVGRSATTEQRKEYQQWDESQKEREKIVNFINKKYPTLEASIGGTISIDIIELGCDKGQTIHHLENAGVTKIVFVGDRCFPGGNDHGIIRELKKSNIAFEWYNVNGPNDTLRLIRLNKVFGSIK